LSRLEHGCADKQRIVGAEVGANVGVEVGQNGAINKKPSVGKTEGFLLSRAIYSQALVISALFHRMNGVI
jgi:hypothetical protein